MRLFQCGADDDLKTMNVELCLLPAHLFLRRAALPNYGHMPRGCLHGRLPHGLRPKRAPPPVDDSFAHSTRLRRQLGSIGSGRGRVIVGE